jgi:DnaD/phage-associated family protein
MATFRQIHTQIWGDPDFEELSPSAKLLFIYLFSNKYRNEAGLYIITLKKISFETGLNLSQLQSAMDEIINKDMVRYDQENSVLWVKNALKYQSISQKTVVAILKDIDKISSPLKSEFFKRYADTLSKFTDTLSKNKDTLKAAADTLHYITLTLTNKLDLNNVPTEVEGTVQGSQELPDKTDDKPINWRNEYFKTYRHDLKDFTEIETLLDYTKPDGGGMDDEVVLEAMKRTQLANKPEMRYTLGILNSWARQGVRSMEDVARVDMEFELAKNRGKPDKTEPSLEERIRQIMGGEVA